MNDEILFWIAMLAILALRQLVGKKRPPVRRKTIPPQMPGQTPRPPDVALPSSGADGGRQTSPPDLGQAIDELRKAFGLGVSPPGGRDPEAFGTSEEQFETAAPFRDYSTSSEERFERRPVFDTGAIIGSTFEQPGSSQQAGLFYDEAFEHKPLGTEVDFHGAWKGHESDFEYHSALEDVRSTPPEPGARLAEPVRRRNPLSQQFGPSSDLQRAVILHEILSPPVSLRPRPVRRHPS